VDLEIHASVAVSYAIWHHDKVFDDKEFLYREGIEMLLQISRYYASCGGWSPIHGDYGFYGVMGPDEFHMMVNHNTYTNYCVQKMFRFTLDVLARMKTEEPDLYAKAVEKVQLRPGETEDWKLKADKMRILRNRKTGLLEQHAGYFDLPHVDIKSLPPDQFPIYKNWAYIKIFRHNMIKQPDLLNLMYFFSTEFTPREKRTNYEFYEARTSHESSLSPSLHAILAAELGKVDDAHGFIAYASRLDLDNYNRNTEQGLHATAGCGVWASMTFGFAGMRTDADHLIFDPTIPAEWNAYRFRIAYRGRVIGIEVNRETATFTLASGSPVTVRLRGRLRKIGKKGLTVPTRT
jgi:maltose phosphorylase